VVAVVVAGRIKLVVLLAVVLVVIAYLQVNLYHLETTQ
tara:strand:- start:1008 stop:1121 length:114 start_codon:yes stop_codon:yes gene_type:complete